MDVGVALGAVSLIFQVFSGCIKGMSQLGCPMVIHSRATNELTPENPGYQLLSEARGLDKDFQFFRVRFKSEQYRLLDWAKIVQLGEDDESLAIPKANRALLLDVLDQQSRLIFRFGRLDERLRPLPKPLLVNEEPGIEDGLEEGDGEVQSRFPAANALLRKSLSFVQRTSRLPTALRWAIADKAKIEELLGRLTALNDSLDQFLSNHQMQQLSSQQTRTNYQIMQLNDKMDHLCELVMAGMLSAQDRGENSQRHRSTISGTSRTLGRSPSPRPDRAGDGSCVEKDLARLAQVKALITAAESGSLTAHFRSQFHLKPSSWTSTFQLHSLELSESDIELARSERATDGDTQRTSAWYKPSDRSWRAVWVEWKSLPRESACHPIGPTTRKRVEALVSLLREERYTTQFRALPCLGYYVHDRHRKTGGHAKGELGGEIEYGFVYENPEGVDPQAPPRSLLDYMLETRPSSGRSPPRVPSLSSRVALMATLAESVERLHAVNWLHKGLRSANVLFFPSCPGDLGRHHDLVPNGGAQMALDLHRPYLTGFDYSRPAASQYSYMSETPPAITAEDLYRHPAVQGRPAGEGNAGLGLGYKKMHDIYSLGIVLLEIAFWKPIFEILGFESSHAIKPREAAGVKDSLLNGEFDVAGWLRGHMGDTIADVIVSCLVGPAAFGLTSRGGAVTDKSRNGHLSDRDDEGVRLQERFFEVVVERLKDLRI